MEAVIAGWVSGYLMAMVTTAALAYFVVHLNRSGRLTWLAGEQASGAVLAVPIFTGTVVIWTLIGVVAGVVFDLASLDDGRNGLGSTALSFTVAVLMVAATPAILLSMLWPRHWWLWISLAATFAGTFGWLMPFLATR